MIANLKQTNKNKLMETKMKQKRSKLGVHVVEGIVFKNLTSIAKAYGMTKAAVYKRYFRGFRGNGLVPKKKRKNYIPTVIESKPLKTETEVAGVKYKSVAEACRENGVEYVTYRSRFYRGWTIEEALGLVPRQDKRYGKKTYLYQDEEFTVDELHSRFGVPISTINDRLERGATVGQAIGKEEIRKGDLITQSQRDKARKKTKKPQLTVDGVTYKTYKALADAYGKKDYVVRQRIVDYSYTPVEAVKLHGKGKKVTIRGVTYNSKADAARAHGMTPELFLARLNNLTPEQTVGLEEYETAFSIEYNGRMYRNLVHLAEEVGIAPHTIRRRRKTGMEIEDAIKAGSKIKNKGRYCETILAREPELANSNAELYFIRIFLGIGWFHKVGVTIQGIKERIGNKGLKYEVISTFEGNLIDVFRIEQQIIDLLKDYRPNDLSSELLDGYTEVLKLNNEEVEFVESFISKRLFSNSTKL